jgi:hypothetical protein
MEIGIGHLWNTKYGNSGSDVIQAVGRTGSPRADAPSRRDAQGGLISLPLLPPAPWAVASQFRASEPNQPRAQKRIPSASFSSKTTSTIARLSVTSCRGMDLPSAAFPMPPRCSAHSIAPSRPTSLSSIGSCRRHRASTCYPNCASAASTCRWFS